MKIVAGMSWPPLDMILAKMYEHSAWYSGDAEVLANYYASYKSQNVLGVQNPIKNNSTFWGRQIKNNSEAFIHVPIAGDIAETSANFLFGESPIIKITQAQEEKPKEIYAESQKSMDEMLMESGFYSRILEAAESCAAIGGIYIKVAWDEDLSEYPIPVIVQADKAIPEFKFGILTAVTFWTTVYKSESGDKVYRLLERYEKGKIINTMYLGTNDKLGQMVPLDEREETFDIDEVIVTPDALFAVYIPNMLPNRLDRSSYSGRSDLSGIEGLMDALDETFSSWMKDVMIAQGKMLIPKGYLSLDGEGRKSFNYDTMVYVEMDVDPTIEGSLITPQQFAIRADDFEKTALNLLDRIIAAAGYSPQSFGLNIAGRAESGTALSIRERKSFATTGKKQNYWQSGLTRVVELMILAYTSSLGGDIALDSEVNITFSDGITNNISETATSIKMLGEAMAISTNAKVRMLHPDWSEEQIKVEVDLIIDENNLGLVTPPDENKDISQLDNIDNIDNPDITN